MKDSPLLWVIGGEPSGDMLGARILTTLRKRYPHLRICGVGGPLMEEAGQFTSLFSYTELSHIGFTSVLRHLPGLIKRYFQTVQHIIEDKPDVLLTIDCPDFALRVSKAVQGKTQRVHCVAPSVWAWRKNRAERLAQQTDCLLHLFRFEADYFCHMKAIWVGHPLADEAGRPISPHVLEDLFPELSSQDPLLCVLPGSRPQEITSCWPVFRQTVEKLRQQLPRLKVIVVTLPQYAPLFSQEGVRIVSDPEVKRAVFARASAALACSGTVTLELALTRTPMVVGYVVHPLVAWILKKIVSTPYVGLVNILAGSCIAQECLQSAFNPNTLSGAVYPLLTRDQPPQFEQQGLDKVWWNVKADTTFAERGADVLASLLKLGPIPLE
jgi:lipid-A-disaccharide synthase